MYDMKTSAVTIRMDADLKRQLNKLCKQTGRSQSEIVRDALKRQFAIIRFRQMRGKILPLAEARGYITDEDVFRDVS
jgi:predicted transcriptional regulator